MSRVEIIEYGGKEWRRYPDSKRRTHRVYYQRHERWKEPPVFLHRKIYEDNYGPIPKGYHVHHIDNNPDNNSIENLQALPPKEHNRITQAEYWGNEEWAEKQRARFCSEEWRKKMSDNQKKMKKKQFNCELCGCAFETVAHNAKICPDCRSMQYSDRNGLHFNKKKQIAKFGKVIRPY